MSQKIQTLARTGCQIHGNPTDIYCWGFKDRIMINITQRNGKMGGTGILAKRLDDQSAFMDMAASEGKETLSDIKFILGSRQDPLAAVYASHILSKIAIARPNDHRQLVLFLALDRPNTGDDYDYGENDEKAFSDVETFNGIMNSLEEMGIF